MNADNSEIQKDKLLSLCEEYIDHIKASEKFAGVFIYGKEKIRKELHDKLCSAFGLKKEDTWSITDNLDRIGYDAEKMFEKLIERT